MRIIQRNANRKIVSKLTEHLETDALALFIIAAVSVATIAIDQLTRNADRAVFTKWRVDRTFHIKGVIVAISGGGIARKLAELRLYRNDVDRTARGITAVQCALRAFQNFDPFEVVKCPCRRCRTAQIYAINVESDRRIGEAVVGVIANAAHKKACVWATRLHDDQRRGSGVQRGCGDNASVRQIIGGQHINRNCRFLQIFRLTLRGDNNIDQTGDVSFSFGFRRRSDVLRICQLAISRHCNQRRCHFQKCLHHPSPNCPSVQAFVVDFTKAALLIPARNLPPSKSPATAAKEN